ncbi:MAG: heme b synthase [Deltaproteobacteria bacterium]|nr:heme b synthase [Deltaproteobacteria bacterium]MBW2051667.1 heme b synthase [Deltaproteobacteria bacterium]MBW2140240.1 heme b synthase [Deltaproteobacteria bacterium]MBW2323438.1 heme b synthase [Deltaproteobacteria bacterium]
MAHPHGSGHPGSHPGGHPGGNDAPRLVAWEVTRACNLTCLHCRAAAVDKPGPDELTTAEGMRLIDQIAAMSRNIILIMTGGEPLLRPDVFDLAAHGTAKGLRVVMAPNGTLITPEIAKKMMASGIQRISISLDGAAPGDHDRFRGVDGAFARTMEGVKYAREAGLEFQVNTTVTRGNLDQIEAIQDMAISMGAVAHHIFLLVPTGRGRKLTGEIISAGEYERVLNWFYGRQFKVPVELKATCAPHYNRVLRQRAKDEGKKVDFATFGLSAVSRGCLGGQGFVFVSHTGRVQPCGYLDLDCGQVRENDFGDIYRTSPIFLDLRNKDCYKGKCGICEYFTVCGGCRARAFEATGDYLAEEPLCLYQPGRAKRD